MISKTGMTRSEAPFGPSLLRFINARAAGFSTGQACVGFGKVTHSLRPIRKRLTRRTAVA